MSVLLVDGDNLLTIGFYGVKNAFHNGEHIGGIYHFLNTLRRTFEAYNLDKIVVFWDGLDGSQTRKKIYAPYKENRKSRLKNEEEISSSAINDIRNELNSLRNVLQFQVSGLIKQERQRANPMHGYLTSRLTEMGISHHIANEIVSYTPEDADERQSWLFLLKLLANRIQTTGNAILAEKGVVALVGPTGTGKTTTIAKLAARAAQKYGAEHVAMVTIDSYRIAAYEQLATYGKIIGCNVKKAQNAEELSDILYQLRNKRLVLIDTAGFGQRDSRLIKQLDTLNQTVTSSADRVIAWNIAWDVIKVGAEKTIQAIVYGMEQIKVASLKVIDEFTNFEEVEDVAEDKY